VLQLSPQKAVILFDSLYLSSTSIICG
jgi:hypothetical protein